MSEELFERLVQFIEDQNKKLTENLTNNFKTEINKIKADLLEVKTLIEEESSRINDLAKKYNNLEEKCVHLERSQKRNNIVIFGLDDKTENLLDYTIRQLNEKLELNLNINHINNIRAVGKPQEKRPIIVEFLSYLTKKEVLKSCKKLKGSEINISSDLSKEDRLLRKKLLIYQKQARSKNLRSYISGNKLIVNDEAYTLEQLEANEFLIDETVEFPEIKANSAPSTPSSISKTVDLQNLNPDEDVELTTKIVKKRRLGQMDLQKSRPETRSMPKK